MVELTHVMHVQENRRSGQRGDVWSVQVDGTNIADDGPDRATGDPADTGTVASWKEAQELAVRMSCRLEPPSPGLRREMVEAGVPAEDARFLLPNATNTNFKITVNFQSLLHICDLRLCTRAQWEFRKVAALMRSEVMKVVPELGRYLQPKCGELRMGYCDESEKDWEACPIGRVRPHKDVLFRIYDSYRKGELQPLREQDWDAIEEKESAAAAEPY